MKLTVKLANELCDVISESLNSYAEENGYEHFIPKGYGFNEKFSEYLAKILTTKYLTTEKHEDLIEICRHVMDCFSNDTFAEQFNTVEGYRWAMHYETEALLNEIESDYILKKEIIKIVIEDVPHRYQKRLINILNSGGDNK